ncbi:GNAT family N-acetyltransferase [Winogradskyella vincentii]|uniref:GNAT family N-acetyltransferase n=1 Tax=Winogradskyella vincentii TaxID=2877122 RepID=A0ABS7Y057_9FLAO|nr:GNAT family N-acetyltransferase [Winogradskyella vincentii]MCA0153310.1 GNAT family N-acetyltransferase [Winogradskyella vincentii]
MSYLIETERLYLRRLTESDATDLFELDSNPKVHKYLGNNPVKSIEESQNQIKNVLKQYEKFGIGRLAMISKETNEFIGWSGVKFERELRKEFDYYDLGYRLKEKYWGHGYATEAAIGSLEYGFNELRLNEINACADVNHVVSNKILKKIGFIPDGTFTFEGSLINWYYLKNKS